MNLQKKNKKCTLSTDPLGGYLSSGQCPLFKKIKTLGSGDSNEQNPQKSIMAQKLQMAHT